MKRISTLLMLLAMGTALFAAQISQQQAMEQARSFINKMKSGNRALKRAQLNVEIQSALPDQQLIYAFNIEDGGFVIVSGDDRTLPVLG
jgi:preprotein translocase subunit YajC